MIATGTPSRWSRALHRAEANRVIAVRMETITDGPDEYHFFRAKSISRPGLTHGVRIACTANGVLPQCSCEGGQKGLPCMHAAQVLRSLGLLPDLMLVETVDDLIAA